MSRARKRALPFQWCCSSLPAKSESKTFLRALRVSCESLMLYLYGNCHLRHCYRKVESSLQRTCYRASASIMCYLPFYKCLDLLMRVLFGSLRPGAREKADASAPARGIHLRNENSAAHASFNSMSTRGYMYDSTLRDYCGAERRRRLSRSTPSDRAQFLQREIPGAPIHSYMQGAATTAASCLRSTQIFCVYMHACTQQIRLETITCPWRSYASCCCCTGLEAPLAPSDLLFIRSSRETATMPRTSTWIRHNACIDFIKLHLSFARSNVVEFTLRVAQMDFKTISTAHSPVYSASTVSLTTHRYTRRYIAHTDAESQQQQQQQLPTVCQLV
ncbi:unnamed protein product [Trichogramma brassicae]|uniref:Uncharacterized protein n=1 Tax=Trichogramma brassicae TaxID=86971 RepID=A0A6H5IDD1_9HYME|nr:unnamed protein product [Trichogramma brassicae]